MVYFKKITVQCHIWLIIIKNKMYSFNSVILLTTLISIVAKGHV